jgi:hypothetical protein
MSALPARPGREAQNELTVTDRAGPGPAARGRALADLHNDVGGGGGGWRRCRTCVRAAVLVTRFACRIAPTMPGAKPRRWPRGFRSCEARVALAALSLERRDGAAAKRRTIHWRRRQPAPPSSDLRCGLYAAAALRNGAPAAALLDRVSASEPMLRAFAAVVTGRSGMMWIDPRTYPWSLIARQPIVAEARARLDAAYSREREIAAAELKGLP